MHSEDVCMDQTIGVTKMRVPSGTPLFSPARECWDEWQTRTRAPEGRHKQQSALTMFFTTINNRTAAGF
jgi:hypothetical protein